MIQILLKYPRISPDKGNKTQIYQHNLLISIFFYTFVSFYRFYPIYFLQELENENNSDCSDVDEDRCIERRNNIKNEIDDPAVNKHAYQQRSSERVLETSSNVGIVQTCVNKQVCLDYNKNVPHKLTLRHENCPEEDFSQFDSEFGNQCQSEYPIEGISLHSDSLKRKICSEHVVNDATNFRDVKLKQNHHKSKLRIDTEDHCNLGQDKLRNNEEQKFTNPDVQNHFGNKNLKEPQSPIKTLDSYKVCSNLQLVTLQPIRCRRKSDGLNTKYNESIEQHRKIQLKSTKPNIWRSMSESCKTSEEVQMEATTVEMDVSSSVPTSTEVLYIFGPSVFSDIYLL